MDGTVVTRSRTSHALLKLNTPETVSRTRNATAAVPGGSGTRAYIALLGGLVQVGLGLGTLAGAVDQRVGAALLALLGGRVEEGAEAADLAGLVGGVPDGVAGHTLALVVDVGLGSGTLAAETGLVENSAVGAGEAGLVAGDPVLGSWAVLAGAVDSGEEVLVALTLLGGGVEGVVGRTGETGLVGGIPDSVTGHALA